MHGRDIGYFQGVDLEGGGGEGRFWEGGGAVGCREQRWSVATLQGWDGPPAALTHLMSRDANSSRSWQAHNMSAVLPFSSCKLTCGWEGGGQEACSGTETAVGEHGG